MLKIEIPAVSATYREALAERICSLGPVKDHGKYFWETLNVISGACQDNDLLEAFGGGAPCTDPFLLATKKEYAILHSEGYSGGDFQLIFLQTWIEVVTDLLII